MKKLLLIATLGLTACANADSEPEVVPGSDLLAPAAGYTRFAPEGVTVGPGEEGTWCQWVAGPAEADKDIVDIKGIQPFPGHHSILFATTATEPVGTMRLCDDKDQIGAHLLGGVGGEGNSGGLPTGTVVRLRKGQGLLMNNHYINTSNKPAVGRAVLDVRFTDPSPDHVVASFFSSTKVKFGVMPHETSTLDVNCVVPREITLLRFANHMHDLGVKVFSEVIGGDQTTVLKRDDTWRPEWAFNPSYALWSVEEPRLIKAGSTIHTQCTWNNPGNDVVTFPREMCVGFGYMLGENDASCVEGAWKE